MSTRKERRLDESSGMSSRGILWRLLATDLSASSFFAAGGGDTRVDLSDGTVSDSDKDGAKNVGLQKK